MEVCGMTDPRWKNGNYRRGLRARMKARGDVCHICKKPIDYSLPFSDPMSFVVDERIPVSRWKVYGYDSPEAVCRDPGNTFAAHKICNARKSNKVGYRPPRPKNTNYKPDGGW